MTLSLLAQNGVQCSHLGYPEDVIALRHILSTDPKSLIVLDSKVNRYACQE
jgi:hypothetical protein